MNRVVLMALAGLFMVAGCSQVNAPAERQEKKKDMESTENVGENPESPSKLANYHVTKNETCQIASQTTACYSVSTDATSGEDFTALTHHFSQRSGSVDAVVVRFFFDEPQASSSGQGFAFNSEEAARDILSTSLPKGADLNKEVNTAMQNGGIYVISIEDEVEQKACRTWVSKVLGPPPKEWDCPGK
jgi:hypothetical protein